MTCGTESPRCGCGRPDAYDSIFGRMCQQCHIERKREQEAAFHYQENVFNEIKYQIGRHLDCIANNLAKAPLNDDVKFSYRLVVDIPGTLPVELVLNGYQQKPVFCWMNYHTGLFERA